MAEERTQQENEGQINLFLILQLVRKNLLLFLLFVIAALFVSYLVNRYSQSIYEISGQLLISEQSGSATSPEQLLRDIPLMDQRPNVENEQIFLKSSKIVGKAVDRLNLPVTYIGVGEVKNAVQYKKASFKVIGEVKNDKLYEKDIDLKVLDKNRVKVSLSVEDEERFNFSKKLRFGEAFSNEYLRFKILRQKERFPFNDISEIKDKPFKFHFNKRSNLVNSFKDRIEIETVGEESTVLSVSIKSPVKERAEDFINALMQVYIDNELNQKSRKASNTIEFIDGQINSMSKSLARAEDSLQQFQVKNAELNISGGSLSTGSDGSGGGSPGGSQGNFFGKMTQIQSELEKIKLQIKSLKLLKRKLWIPLPIPAVPL
jgi:uncharacterized protein involved in exopolysaccharide biosynthesis